MILKAFWQQKFDIKRLYKIHKIDFTKDIVQEQGVFRHAYHP